MRIILTGDKGMIGSKLALKIGEYIGIDTRSGQDILTCELPNDIDLIFHLAAHASVEDSWKDPVRELDNIATTVRLAHRYPDAKIIFANTGASINPDSPYGFSKKCAADYLKRFHKNSVILVFPNIFGGPRSVVDIFKGKSEVSIYGDGLQVRDYVHVDDIVKALILAQNWPSGEYFLGSGKGTTVAELAQGKSIKWLPARREQRESILPNTTPNWKPEINVFDYLKS